ncbi:MAG: TIGR04013 family B12-binding domain/radical SAM domain-containing protein [Acidobacteria bacterium]|nr:MAG: TIGR04013 family B12-binding domain/radical SAM domain-containing protein [Acidobacteriota bacterium]
MNKSRRLTLIWNDRRTNSYAINVLTGALETALSGCDVEILFLDKPAAIVSAVRRALDGDRHVLVGWSFYSPEFRTCATELQWIKRHIADPRVLHLAGGVHATAEPEQTLRAGFDLVAIGEGEKTLIALVRRLLDGDDDRRLRGLASLDHGRYVSHGPGARIELDEFPPFTIAHRRFNPIEITRGCVYACRFCQTPFMFKARFRHRSVENICHYVEVMKAHGLTDVRFISPTALSYGSADESVNLDKVEELLASIRRVLGREGRIFFGTFPSEVRPEHVTREALMVLKKYVANDNLVIGGQTGSSRLLDFSRRGHTVADIVTAVEISLEVGFLPNVDFIFGLPGETPEDVEASLRLAERLADMGARIHGHTFMPLPGTPFQNAPPGTIHPETQRRLDRLATSRKLYGQWRRQMAIARDLAEMRATAKSERRSMR